MSKKQIDKMVDRFLCWKLPQGFAPDCGISFKHSSDAMGYEATWPVGTNLFTAEQAKEMIEHVLGAPLAPPDRYDTKEEGDAYTTGYFDGVTDTERVA